MDKQKTPAVMDLDVLAEATGVKRRSDRPKKRPRVFAEPKGQIKGPIVAGPTEWVVCTTCSGLFSTKTNPVRFGIRKRHAAKHLADHRMGRVKRPKTTPRAEHRDLHRREAKGAKTGNRRGRQTAVPR